MLSADSADHLAKAEAFPQDAIRQDPEADTAIFFIGLVNEARAQLDQALAFYERTVKINPSHAAAYAQFGHVATAMGRAAEGLEHIRYALRLSPSDPQRSHWLRFAGEAELELGHRERAIDLLRQSYALNARQPLTLRSLAAAHAAAGRLDDARLYLAELKEAAPHLSPERLLKRPLALQSHQPELARGLRLALAH